MSKTFPSKSTRGRDHCHGGSAAPVQEPVIEEINLDNYAEDENGWVNLIAVGTSERERQLIADIQRLGHDVGHRLRMAHDVDAPGAMRRQLRVAIAGQKNMLMVIRALDYHRSGANQRIVVQHGETAAPLAVECIKGPKLRESDTLLEEFFMAGVENLDVLAAYCRKRADILGGMPANELLCILEGKRIGPDRRRWEMEFMSLAAYLTGQAAKFGQAIEARRKGVGIQVVHTYAKTPKSRRERKAKAKALSKANPFLIGQGISKAKKAGGPNG